jgi:hypothetical protein
VAGFEHFNVANLATKIPKNMICFFLRYSLMDHGHALPDILEALGATRVPDMPANDTWRA